MDLAALIVAIVGVALGSASLGWQVVHYLLTGARVRVTLKYAMLGPGGAITAPMEGSVPDMVAQQASGYGYTQPALAVEVVNRGRMPVDVDRVAIRLSGGLEYFETQPGAYNPPMPHRLEPQSNQTFYVSADPIHAAASAARSSGIAKDSVVATGKVTLGNGDVVVTKESAPMPA